MTDFVPFWEDKEFVGGLGPSPLPEDPNDLFSVNLLCDEETLDAVVPEPVDNPESCLISRTISDLHGNDSPNGSANWRSFLDKSASLSRRVSVTVTGKRKIDSETSPPCPQSTFQKRPKSVNMSFAHTNEGQPPFFYQHHDNVGNGIIGRGNVKRYTFGYGSIREGSLQVRCDGTAAITSPRALSKRNAYRQSTSAIDAFARASEEPKAFVDDFAAKKDSMEFAPCPSESLPEAEFECALDGLDFRTHTIGDVRGLSVQDGACGMENKGPHAGMLTAQEQRAMSDFTDSSENPVAPDGHVSEALAIRLQSISAARESDDTSISSSLMSGHLHLPTASTGGLPEVTSAIQAVTVAAQAYSVQLTDTSSPRRDSLETKITSKRQGFRQGHLSAFALKSKKKKFIAMRVPRKRSSLTKFDEPLMPKGSDVTKTEREPSALEMYITCGFGGMRK